MGDGTVGMAVPQAPQRSLQRAVTQIPTQQHNSKASRLSRISSYIGLASVARAGSPTTSTLPEVVMQRSESMKTRAVSYNEAAHDRSTGIWRTSSDMESGYNNFRESDRTWHSPNVIQMMETVSCAMMANGISEPIPRHLNASIISMVEEFRPYLSKMTTLQADFDRLRNARQAEAKEFTNMAHEWKMREIAFRAEIKRLEQIISHTQEGVGSVILARASSIVDRHDGMEFLAELDRLSKSKDGSSGYNKGAENVNMEEMRTSITLPDTTLNDRPKLIADNDRDVRLTELLLSRNAPDRAPKQVEANLALRAHMVAAQHLYNTTGRSSSPRDAVPTNGPPAQKFNVSATLPPSTVSRTTSSSSSDARNALTKTTDTDNVAPRTTWAKHPVQKPDGENALVVIREMLVHGRLPENAVDDDSGSDNSYVVSPQHNRRFSFATGDDQPTASNGVPIRFQKVTVKKHPKYSQVQGDHLLAVPEAATISHFTGLDHNKNNAMQRTGIQIPNSSLPSSSSSSSSQNSHRSSAPISMGYNHTTGWHIGNGNKAASDGSPASKASSRQGSVSSASVGGSPFRKAQSALDITLSQETIDAARKGRTIDNYHTKTASFARPEDFLALPPQTVAYTPGQQRPRYTNGPPPALTVPPLFRRGQTRLRRQTPPPARQARAPEITGNEDAITAAISAVTRSGS